MGAPGLSAALRPLAPDLWVVDGPERVAGLRIGTRMTVVRLADGRLWLHSPVPRGAALVRALDALGPVAFLVAPNRVHHLWIGEWAEALPGATVYGAPGLREKRRDVVFHRELGPDPPPEWAPDLDQVRVAGAPYVNEVVFRHRASRTVLVTDWAMNFDRPPSGAVTRLFVRAMGLAGGVRTSRLVRSLVRDRAASAASLQRVLDWDVDRLVVTHGAVLETGARAALAEAWSWLGVS